MVAGMLSPFCILDRHHLPNKGKKLTLPDNSRQSIKKYVQANNQISVASQAAFDAQFNKAIKAGVEKGEFTQPKGKPLDCSTTPCCRHHVPDL